MPNSRPDPALLPAKVFTLVGLACLAVITLVDNGATSMYASPWRLLFWFAQLAPFGVLVLRSLSLRTPFMLPSRAWCILAACFAAIVLVSALASPFRGPSLLCALLPLSGLATFFCLHDWLSRADSNHRAELINWAALAGGVIAAVSLIQWLANALASPDPGHGLAALLTHRNDRPLGHSNYAAGLALLALPWLGATILRARGFRRVAACIGALLALAMLFTSGSRGGLLGLAALVFAALLSARLGWKKLLLCLTLALAAALALSFAHPRTRKMFFEKTSPSAAPNISAVQRSAMITAALHMGADRPLLGWGPGNVPLVFPRYRAALDGGVENALQLHSTPAQLLAELGVPGVIVALAFLFLALRSSSRCPTATIALSAYAVFALTDYQLDVPIFAFAVAACAALLAVPAYCQLLVYNTKRSRQALAAIALATLCLVGFIGQPDPAPALNVRALSLAHDPAQTDRAIALFRESLTLNPDQEIAHFNLGWLLVIRDPAAAEKHFLAAAHLVPDKGGVHFGLALARLNQAAPRARIVHALALESINDPLFLTSPWWREASLRPLQAGTILAVARLTEALRAAHALTDARLANETRYVAALARWLVQTDTPGEILARANTSARVAWFARRLPPPDFTTAAIRSYHRERTGYPVLMRNLDLPVPTDLFDVQENLLASGEFAFLFPTKGWLPSPLLIALLDEKLPRSE